MKINGQLTAINVFPSLRISKINTGTTRETVAETKNFQDFQDFAKREPPVPSLQGGGRGWGCAGMARGRGYWTMSFLVVVPAGVWMRRR